MRLIFMGTPDFAAVILERLIKEGHEILLAVTQPDKPKGRGKAMQSPPVKVTAASHGIAAYQPSRVRDPSCVAHLAEYAPDAIVVAAFGQILPKEILEMPRFCCVNIHASLLPKYRGASPIQAAILKGEEVTGVTAMRMDEGMDTGDIILQEEVPIGPEDTGGILFDKLAQAGASLCVRALAAIEDGTAAYEPQDGEEATYTHVIKKRDGRIDWSADAIQIERLIRGLNPWPSAYTSLRGKTLKIWRSRVKEGDGRAAAPGTVLSTGDGCFEVQAGNGALILEEVQLEGKKRMPAPEFLRGFRVEPGTVLGGLENEP